MKLSNRVEKSIVFGLTLLAFLLRAYRLDAQSYWIDEAWTVYFANLSISELWHLLLTVEPFPPLYHPSTVYWVKLVGDGEYALRFYSLVFGVMAVPFTYRLGKDLGDNRLGLLAALLMTAAPYQIWHSQDARMYSALTASSAMSMWGFVNLWKRGGWHWWLVYVLGTLWAIMSHYHGVVLVGIQVLFLLLTLRHRWRDRRFKAWGSALAMIFLLLMPWLYFGGKLLGSYLNWIEQPTLWDTFIRSAIAYSVGELVPRSQAIPLTLVFVALYALGLVYVARRPWGAWRGSEVLGLLLAYSIAPNIAAWLYGQIRTPVYFERYLIPVQVGYLLVVSAGILAVAGGLRKHLTWGAPALAGAATLLLIGINGWVLTHHYADPAYAKPNWRSVAHTIQAYETPDDAVVITGDGGEKAFGFYYQGDLPVFLDFNTPVPPEHLARQTIAEIAATHARIWYTPYGVQIDATLENWLASNAYPAWQSWMGRKRLALYGGLGTVSDRNERLNVSFVSPTGESLTLESAAIPAETIAAGDVLPLTLVWRATTDIEADYKLSLRLRNEQGDLFVQSDWPPLTAAEGTSSWKPNQPITDLRGLWLPPDIPPGSYILQLVVYDPVSGQPLGQPAVIPSVKVGPAETIAPLEAMSIPNPIQKPLGALGLVGYALPESIIPGEEVWLWLYWQAKGNEHPATVSTVRLSLTSDTEAVSADFPLTDSAGPLDSWQPGQVRRAVYHLPSSPRLSGYQRVLKVTLLSETDEIKGETTLAPIRLEVRPRQFEAPPIASKTSISFENPILLKLIGYDLPSTELEPGETLPVTLYWQAEAEMDTNYTVFLQLMNSNRQVVAQEDLPPQAGAAPTTSWLPGEILSDAYILSLPGDLPPDSYQMIVGMYDPTTGRRLAVSTGDDFVELATVTVQ